MKKTSIGFLLSGFTLLILVVLWAGRHPAFQDAAPSAVRAEAKKAQRTMAARNAAVSPSNPSPASIKSISSLPALQAPTSPGKLPTLTNPSLNAATDGEVQDTGEFIDADAEIPPQPEGKADVPMDTGPFIDAD
jgi:hypothetical protein